jgi:hypothetical protein
MDAKLPQLLTELIEQVRLLQRDIEQLHDLEKYEGRLARIEQKRSALTRQLPSNPADNAATDLADLSNLLIEFVEKVGLLRRDMQQRKELDQYEGPIARVEQKLSALIDQISQEDAELAKKLRSVWQLPARSLAFRNADHRKKGNRES